MTVSQLEYFIAVAESLNFTRAAEQFYVSQTAVTQQIKALENQLGFSLFHRDKRRVSLTAGGQIYYHEIKAVLERLQHAQIIASHAQDGTAGTLRIGFLPGMERSPLSTLIQTYITQFPNVQVELQSGTNAVLLRKLQSSELDLVFSFQNTMLPDGLMQIPYMDIPHYALLHKNHYLSYRGALSRKDLCNERFIMIQTAQEDMLHAFIPYGFQPKNILFADDMSSLMMMLSANLGVAILPEYNIESAPSMDSIAHIPMSDTQDVFHMVALYPVHSENPCVTQMVKAFS